MPKKNSSLFRPLIFFGLYGFSHGWARILTVMSPEGVGAIITTVKPGDGIHLQAGNGKLPQYHERREGALNRLAEEFGIVILTKAEWDSKKSELGDAIYM